MAMITNISQLLVLGSSVYNSLGWGGGGVEGGGGGWRGDNERSVCVIFLSYCRSRVL